MSVPSQLGIFGWQDATGSDDSGVAGFNNNTHGAGWYRHKASEISFGGIQDLRTFPPEVGGELIPTGAYKNGLYVGGGVSLQPRVQEVFGHLLKAMMGQARVTDVGTLSAATVVPSVAGNIDTIANLVLTGGATVTLSPPSVLVCTTVNMDVGATQPVVLITGTDAADLVISESRILAANGTIVTNQAFKTVVTARITTVTTPDVATLGSVVIGSYTALPYAHLFTMAPNQALLGWLNLRKWIPGSLSNNALGETMLGCKITGARLTIPASGIVTARMEFQGRKSVYTPNPGWDTDAGYWDSTHGDYEDTTSVPIGSAVGGFVQLPTGVTAIVTSLIVNWANNVSTPEQEKIVGSPFPDDVVALSRAMSIQATIKWKDPDLFNQIYTGAAAGGSWVAKPFTSDFVATVLAPNDIPGAAAGVKYQLDVNADNVMWNCNGPITLAGADLVMMPIIGTVVKANAANPYATFKLYNARSTAY